MNVKTLLRTAAGLFLSALLGACAGPQALVSPQAKTEAAQLQTLTATTGNGSTYTLAHGAVAKLNPETGKPVPFLGWNADGSSVGGLDKPIMAIQANEAEDTKMKHLLIGGVLPFVGNLWMADLTRRTGCQNCGAAPVYVQAISNAAALLENTNTSTNTIVDKKVILPAPAPTPAPAPETPPAPPPGKG